MKIASKCTILSQIESKNVIFRHSLEIQNFVLGTEGNICSTGRALLLEKQDSPEVEEKFEMADVENP